MAGATENLRTDYWGRFAHLCRYKLKGPKEQTRLKIVSGNIYQVAISAYVTFRGESDSEEEYVDRIFDEFRDFLESHPDKVDLETKLDYSHEVTLRPPLKRD